LTDKLTAYFFTDFNFKVHSLWFKATLYLIVVISCLYWAANFELYFGQNSIVYRAPKPFSGIHDFAYLLYNHQNWTSGAITFAGALALVSLILKKSFFAIDFLIWLIVLNIHNSVYPGLTGGDYLLNQFLFFSCFISYRQLRLDGFFNDLKVCLHNFGVVAVMIQVCLLYFISGYAKLTDSVWQEGTAIDQILQIRHFSMMPALGDVLSGGVLSKTLNYFVLFYQLFFPLFIFLKPIKKYFIICGILMHLYIAFFMGLVSFGLIMLLSYIFFWPFRHKEF